MHHCLTHSLTHSLQTPAPHFVKRSISRNISFSQYITPLYYSFTASLPVTVLYHSSLTASLTHSLTHSLLYSFTHAVVSIEIIKFIICHVVVLVNEGFNLQKFLNVLHENLDWREVMLISVPALVYTVQNNLLFIALEYLDPTTFQLCYQVSRWRV